MPVTVHYLGDVHQVKVEFPEGTRVSCITTDTHGRFRVGILNFLGKLTTAQYGDYGLEAEMTAAEVVKLITTICSEVLV